MIKSEHIEQPLVTSVKTDLWAHLEAMHRQISEMSMARENNNTPTDSPIIVSEIQVLKQKMEEYSKQLKKS